MPKQKANNMNISAPPPPPPPGGPPGGPPGKSGPLQLPDEPEDDGPSEKECKYKDLRLFFQLDIFVYHQ